jgi:hypothetical protein
VPPAKTASSDVLSKGDELEARVAQLWFWEGYFARRGVDLRRQFYPEPLVVTDLDLLAYDFSPMLWRTKTIGEVKTGTGKNAPKPLDRIVWLRGLRELVGADQAELTTSVPTSARARELARSLGVRVQSQEDIERREAAAGVAEVANLGSHGPLALLEERWVHRHCARDRDLERAYWFLRSEVWFLDEVTAAKRTVGLYRQLSDRWTPEIDDDDARALRWLFAEAVSVFTLNTVAVAAGSLVDNDTLFSATVGERLSGGVVSADAMRRISADVDRYIGGLLAAAHAPADLRVDAIGVLHPEPPEWTESFLDLTRRLALSRGAARSLPRQIDVLVFERLTRRRHVPAVAVARIDLDDSESGRLIHLIGAFLRSQASNVAVVDKVLTTPVEGSNAMGKEPTADDSRELPPGQAKGSPPDDDKRQGTLLEYLN